MSEWLGVNNMLKLWFGIVNLSCIIHIQDSLAERSKAVAQGAIP